MLKMALKTLVLRKKIDSTNKSIEALRAKLEELNLKDEEFNKREAELEEAINEVNEETSEEDKNAVDEAVKSFDEEKSAHQEEVKSVTEEIEKLESEVADSEKELNELEEAQEDKEPKTPAPEAVSNERKVNYTMEKRFQNWTIEERSAFVERNEMKDFLANVRSLARGEQTRGVTGADLLIPDTFLGIIRAEAQNYSKLVKHINLKKVSGTARAVAEGDIPEGIWMEACDALKELTVTFTDVEVDAYKVGGYIPVCNATLADSDVNLASELATLLGQGLGYALDKAIVYGTGSKMPKGFAGTATKTHTTGTEGKALYKGIAKACAKLKHATGNKFWVVNPATKMELVAEAMEFNSNGAIVSGVTNQMPVVGGEIIELDFVPENEILGGYGNSYLLAERQGNTIAKSEHAMFVEDKTVFKATARYDGKPVYEDSFVAIGIGATDATGTIDGSHPFAGNE